MTLTDREDPLEIRDPKGVIVGFVVPEKHFRALLGERETMDALRNQMEQLEKQLTEVGRQRDEARNALSDLEKMFQAWNAYGVVPPRESDIERARESGIRGRELVAEIEKLLYPGSDEDQP